MSDGGPRLYPVPGVAEAELEAVEAAAPDGRPSLSDDDAPLGEVTPLGDGDARLADDDADGGAPPSSDGVTPPRERGRRGRFISDVIVELGFLPKERVDAAVEEARTSGRTPEQVLLEAGALTSDQLARATAERFGLDHVDLTLYRPDLGALNLVSAQAARRYNAVPIGFDGGTLLVAMADPSNVLALDDLKLLTKHEIRPVVASSEDIQSLIGRMNRLDDAVAEAIEEDASEDLALVSEIRESADDAPVIKLVNSVFAQAIEEGASDIHFEPDGRDMRVRFRVDGVLSESTTIPRRMVAGVISRVKIMANLDIAERRVPQDGRVSLNVEGHAVDLRVVTLPSVNGEGIVVRVLDKEQVLLTLDMLGMRDEARERFEAGFRQSYGAVLVTGPTGSGKSTTLYAALNAINDVQKNIITIEDPVEYQLEGINQVQVNLKAGLTFATGLRAMLRADPDVIMVGEIRDAETARIAIESALTGHLVLSTLHTNDAPSAITRLTEMGIEPFLTASAVDVVLAQRLARTLCKHCKERTVLTVESLRAAGFDAAFDIEAYEPKGCARCNHTGYRGRIGLYEVMTVSEEIRELTIERASADEIRKVAVEQGMRALRADGLEKVRLGLTSIAEVARVT
ncbi:MAG: Flp pilus assembly complex ATPase component TadA [Thermoleophilaceae bacterium]|nr:Flp pilus assembly complex ATPase component TadA [Thermoleophilaceae bacterium]